MVSTETTYPVTFRKKDAEALGKHLLHHNSVVLIGMKRVGINNFLRFFLRHPAVPSTYQKGDGNRMFILVDLNDLVERDISPFWTLTLKRLTDAIEQGDFSELVKADARRLFTESIQLRDQFVTLDSVQKALTLITDSDFTPTIIFNRFDRLTEAMTPELFSNLQGLKDAVKRQISFLFTSFRPLSQLRPDVFAKASLTVFSHDQYLKPAKKEDMRVVLETLLNRYDMTVAKKTKDDILALAGGHVQYLHIAILKLHELGSIPKTKEALTKTLLASEEITLQSEELFANLTPKEQEIIVQGNFVKTKNVRDARYLWESGIITDDSNLFSPFFEQYVFHVSSHKNGSSPDFTKKEFLLFSYLEAHEGQLCERDTIIAAVWPEYADSGVSDWAVDRLIARVRAKLKEQKSPYEIVTIITRGYKLIRNV